MKKILAGSFLGIFLSASAIVPIAFAQNINPPISYGPAPCVLSLCVEGMNLIHLINDVLVPVLFAISFILFLFGIANKYIFSHGDPGKVKEGHQLMIWGIIGFVIMISVWGLVNLSTNTLGLAGSAPPPLPTSY